ncbi:SAVED domain-containing protein, partial [Nitrincola sp.]|uniref:SAVED domain-containing protein n=1 Tax=Nitrincola sp. TaxID=1926584 RepID=UPI003A8FF753
TMIKVMDVITATTQTLQPPLEDLSLVETHKLLLENLEQVWSDVGILTDKDQHATLILLLDKMRVVAVLRFSLSAQESRDAVALLVKSGGKVYLRNYQQSNYSVEELRCLSTLQERWDDIQGQDVALSLDEIGDYFRKVETGCRDKGRGADFSTDTKRQVMLASHGRCMFEGCGENLGFEGLSGYEGNFAYLAHNIASSEYGTRGVPVLSGKLSNDPQNILLLCDKHHRLVDKVAKAEFPAERLAKMRHNFTISVNQLLDGIAYEQVPAYAILWPVHRNVISAPSLIQISQCLAVSKQRIVGQLHDLSDNEALLRNLDPTAIKLLMAEAINSAADRLLGQLHSNRYRSALFAFGSMSALIGLGARLGNKNEITPMLRYRDGGQWCWPREFPVRAFYEIKGVNSLGKNESEIVLQFTFTASPAAFKAFSDEQAKRGIKTINVTALEERMGNAAIGHPEEGKLFTKEMQGLLMRLRDAHGVKVIHLLPCASNAACVFFGRAYDANHPEVVVYDFEDTKMHPVLRLLNERHKCNVMSYDIK